MDWMGYEYRLDNGGTAPGSPRFYDTHAGVRRLTGAGIEEPHAEAIVTEQFHVAGQNASKVDIMVLRQEVRAEIAAVRGDTEKLRQEVRADNEKLEQKLRAEIKDLKASIVMWGAGYGLAIIAALKLL